MRVALLLMLLTLACVGLACRSTGSGRNEPRSASSRPVPAADPLSSDQPHQMAADDAARFRPPPANKPAVSRRPRINQRRRAVDQPRIRP